MVGLSLAVTVQVSFGCHSRTSNALDGWTLGVTGIRQSACDESVNMSLYDYIDIEVLFT